MRAAGMNDLRITRSLWLASFVLAGLFLWLNASIIPYCKENSRKIYDNAMIERELKSSSNVERVGLVKPLCFNNRRDCRLWFMNSFSKTTNRGTGVRISIFDGNAREVGRVMAREGVYDDVDKCWFFLDGQYMKFDPQTGRLAKPEIFGKRYFKDYKERPQIMILSMSRPQDLSLSENKILLDAFGNDEDYNQALPYMVRQYSIWVSPLICVIVLAIAIPFSMTGVRTNPMVGVSKTFGLFFLFYVIDSVMTALGGRGIISAEVAAIAPNLAMFIFAMSLYRKAI